MTPDQDRKLTRQAAWIIEHPYLPLGLLILGLLAILTAAMGVKYLADGLAK